MAELAQIGVTGLAVMGRNLARNFARHGHRVAIHNRSYARTEALFAEAGSEGEFVPSESMADFVASLERPRRVLIMVKAGAGTDAVIDELTPLMEEGDIVIDAGNAHFPDTIRREAKLAEIGLHFVGTGVSGGEEGALNGPSSCRVVRLSRTSRWVHCWKALPPRSMTCRVVPMWVRTARGISSRWFTTASSTPTCS